MEYSRHHLSRRPHLWPYHQCRSSGLQMPWLPLEVFTFQSLIEQETVKKKQQEQRSLRPILAKYLFKRNGAVRQRIPEGPPRRSPRRRSRISYGDLAVILPTIISKEILNFRFKQPLNFIPLARYVFKQENKGFFEIIFGGIIVKSPYERCSRRGRARAGASGPTRTPAI